jgi:hypothetical protein
VTAGPPAAHEIWREFHWAFFLKTQGLILCLRRFELCLDRDDLASADVGWRPGAR